MLEKKRIMADVQPEEFDEEKEDNWDPRPENWGEFPVDYSKYRLIIHNKLHKANGKHTKVHFKLVNT